MPLYLKFGRVIKKPISNILNLTEFTIWKEYYRPPIRFLFIFIEIFCIFFYFRKVALPSIMTSYHIRQMLVSIFFLENHESPISNSNQLNDYYLDLTEKVTKMKNDFLLNVSFPNNSKLIYFTFLFSNQTVTIIDNPLIDAIFLKNITTILTEIPLFIFSNKKNSNGCQYWIIKLIVSKLYSDPAFFLSSKIYRYQCPNKFDFNLSYFLFTKKIIIPLLIILFFHLLINFYSIKQSFLIYKIKNKEDQNFKILKGSTQIHYVLGIWLPLETLIILLSFFSTILLIYDSYLMTDLPSLTILKIFSISSATIIITSLQWFKYTDFAYRFVEILREGSGMLLTILIGFFPIICGFLLAGIFIFAHIAPKTRSIWSMIEILISFTLGDNIQPTYVDFTDGTTLFNWLAFIYITSLVLVAGWVVFASFTAAVAFIHKTLVLKEKLD